MVLTCSVSFQILQWFRLLLYPRWKPRDKDELQGFAVDRPEPLVHFALSSGSHSDPVVRAHGAPTQSDTRSSNNLCSAIAHGTDRSSRLQVRLYSPKRLFQQLEAAKEEFIRGNVGVRGSGRRVILPKVLESYARDAGLAAQELLRVVESCLPEGLRAAAAAVRQQGRARGGVEWRPHNMAFRYALARELVGSPAGVQQAVTPSGA